ncbi:hypothetical protein J7K43_07585, partial [Candidatus Calescamantes bacterium]|nr:hypothetical protein [Candidatus Calescamantes bacterium]
MLELIPRSFNTWEDFVKYYVYGGIFKKIKRQIESYSNSNWPNGVFYYEAMDWENEVFTELEIKTKAKLLKLKSNMIRLKRLNIGKLPEDPFTGETIKFLEQNGQIIFFSAGRNLKYENGKGDDIKIFLSLSEDIMPGN